MRSKISIFKPIGLTEFKNWDSTLSKLHERSYISCIVYNGANVLLGDIV